MIASIEETGVGGGIDEPLWSGQCERARGSRVSDPAVRMRSAGVVPETAVCAAAVNIAGAAAAWRGRVRIRHCTWRRKQIQHGPASNELAGNAEIVESLGKKCNAAGIIGDR